MGQHLLSLGTSPYFCWKLLRFNIFFQQNKGNFCYFFPDEESWRQVTHECCSQRSLFERGNVTCGRYRMNGRKSHYPSLISHTGISCSHNLCYTCILLCHWDISSHAERASTYNDIRLIDRQAAVKTSLPLPQYSHLTPSNERFCH